MFGLRYLPGVVTLTLDETKCTGCGMCVSVCPHGVFELEDRKAKLVDRDACMECGACARNCAAEAIAVRAGVGCACAVLTGGCTPSCGCST
jgi:NAD-dependent dihydropyrimidine dehydrogenase PreA subunit